MFDQAHRGLILAAIFAFAMPALADDCATAAKSAMVNSGHTPKSSTTTVTDSHGKQSATRTIQTTTNQYVQVASGKWYSMGIAIKDLIDDSSTTKVTCRRVGSESVNGESATAYEIQTGDGGSMAASKIWVSSKNLLLKSQGSSEGVSYVTVYDYAHVTPPAGVETMGGN